MDNELTIDFIRMGIETLKKTGKLLPEEYKLRELPLAERKKAELQQINTLADIWANIFIGRNIDCDRWSTAVFLAAALEGREHAVITPALMQEGLRQEEAKRRAQASESSYKTTTDFEAAERATRAEDFRVLWAWTKLQLAQGRRFQYLPTNEQITEFIVRNKIPGEIWRKQTAVIKAFLSDQNRVNALGGEKELKLTINREQMKLSLQLLH